MIGPDMLLLYLYGRTALTEGNYLCCCAVILMRQYKDKLKHTLQKTQWYINKSDMLLCITNVN